MLSSFQDYLSAAVQLKTALVKAKPSRQEWEQAPPFLRCTAAAPDSVQRARQGGFSIQYSTALQLKEQGNELIPKEPAAALERYTQALSVFLWFDRGPDRAAEDIPLRSAAEKLQGAEQEQSHQLLATCFSNAAACLLRLEQPADAAYACSKALKYDPYNVKALYRRALAQRQTGTTAGLEAAAADLAAANQLEPGNNQVRQALAAVRQELREQRRKERDMYGDMFQRGGALYDDHDDQPAGPAGRGGTAAAAAAEGDITASQRRGAQSAGRAAAEEEEEEYDGEEGWDPEDLLFKEEEVQRRKVGVHLSAAVPRLQLGAAPPPPYLQVSRALPSAAPARLEQPYPYSRPHLDSCTSCIELRAPLRTSVHASSPFSLFSFLLF
ncbi:hypothetical protein Agub_g3828 [Astrephomene gubernaculifera]|uniref:Uncharacterized protein n=1 Tax=Astrephomene gubernaculifera TaxID=47775 RepID=A0AAD3DJC5_9CHLO|nr:hypothetical protein Agub_g3828 [Astrephomene gubernaculifera]